MCNCEKVSTCGEFIFSTCVKYEGNLPVTSKYYNDCDVTAEETIEELYELIGGIVPDVQYYYAGEGLNLTGDTFRVSFGTTSTTVKRGDWKPDWNNDILNKPNIPEPVNIVAGNNITVTGVYPNIQISASGKGDENVIESIILGTETAPIISKTVTVPVTSRGQLGLMKVGTGLVASVDGTVSLDYISPSYTAGTGINISGTVINNSSPNANHTGDVTGATALTITDGVVTNAKLANAPQTTVKGNLGATAGVVQDVTLSDLKTALNITNQTLVYESFPQTVALNQKLHTAVFTTEDAIGSNLIIPNGQFDGQIVHVVYEGKMGTRPVLSGTIIVWKPGATNTVVQAYEERDESNWSNTLYWSTIKQAWLLKP